MVLKTIAVLFILVALNSHCCYGVGISWQRLARRANVRAALASKLDPNFWPTRGRRSDMTPSIFLQKNFEDRRQTSDEEGPFWANRGRSLASYFPSINNISFQDDHQMPEDLSQYLLSNEIKFDTSDKTDLSKNGFLYTAETPNFSVRSDKTDEGPFWANRGRSLTQMDWYNKIQKLIKNDETQERSTDEGPFWANRGRAVEQNHELSNFELYSLLGNLENRDADLSKNVVKNDKEAPFWANRGRSLSKLPKHFQREVLYAEEPGWVLMTQRNGRRSALPSTAEAIRSRASDTFWGARGKKSDEAKEDVTCDSNGNQCSNKAKLKPIENVYHFVKNENE